MGRILIEKIQDKGLKILFKLYVSNFNFKALFQINKLKKMKIRKLMCGDSKFYFICICL